MSQFKTSKKICKCVDCSEARHERAIAESYKIAEQDREWKNEQWDRL